MLSKARVEEEMCTHAVPQTAAHDPYHAAGDYRLCQRPAATEAGARVVTGKAPWPPSLPWELAQAARVNEGRRRRRVRREGERVGIDNRRLEGIEDGGDRLARRQSPHEVAETGPDGESEKGIKLVPVLPAVTNEELAEGIEESKGTVSRRLHHAGNVSIRPHGGAKHRGPGATVDPSPRRRDAADTFRRVAVPPEKSKGGAHGAGDVAAALGAGEEGRIDGGLAPSKAEPSGEETRRRRRKAGVGGVRRRHQGSHQGHDLLDNLGRSENVHVVCVELSQRQRRKPTCTNTHHSLLSRASTPCWRYSSCLGLTEYVCPRRRRRWHLRRVRCNLSHCCPCSSHAASAPPSRI